MGKHEYNSVKAISNRIKSKGLQQLRFYCQMCEKQCRDENGFKCHSTSEAHMRQMALFAANPDRFMDTFSAGFEKGFMELLQRRFGTRRVKANYVYNEYIQDRDHIHMNGTMWTTLTDFVKYLGRTGKCVIEEETSGPDSAAWWITWINRDPEAVRRQEIALKRREREQGDEAREIDEVDLIAARARAEAGLSDNDNDKLDEEEEEEEEKDGKDEEEAQEDDGSDNNTRKGVNIKKGTIQSELKREEGAAPLRISLSAPSTAIVMPLGGKKRSRWESELEQSISGPTAPLLSSSSESHFTHSVVNSSSISQLSSQAHPVSQAEMLMREEQALKQKKKEREEAIASAALAALAASAVAAAASATTAKASQTVSSTLTSLSSSNVAEINEEWVAPGIIIKVLNKKVGGGKYYKQKGKVMSVNADGFTGIISMLDTGDILQIDQQDLETVVPAIGKQVLILNGKGKGLRAKLINLHVETFSADLELEGGERLNNILYENFSKSSE